MERNGVSLVFLFVIMLFNYANASDCRENVSHRGSVINNGEIISNFHLSHDTGRDSHKTIVYDYSEYSNPALTCGQVVHGEFPYRSDDDFAELNPAFKKAEANAIVEILFPAYSKWKEKDRHDYDFCLEWSPTRFINYPCENSEYEYLFCYKSSLFIYTEANKFFLGIVLNDWGYRINIDKSASLLKKIYDQINRRACSFFTIPLDKINASVQFVYTEQIEKRLPLEDFLVQYRSGGGVINNFPDGGIKKNCLFLLLQLDKDPLTGNRVESVLEGFVGDYKEYRYEIQEEGSFVIPVCKSPFPLFKMFLKTSPEELKSYEKEIIDYFNNLKNNYK